MNPTDYPFYRDSYLYSALIALLKPIPLAILLIAPFFSYGANVVDNSSGDQCGPCEEYCTLTIGYWGTHREAKGNNGLPGTSDLIPGGITISADCFGFPMTKHLTLDCVHSILPPKPEYDCGQYSNNLIRQYIGLYLNTLLDEDLGDLKLGSIRCIDLNSTEGTVQNLLERAAKLIVCGGYSTSIAEDMDAINERFDECQKNTNCDGSCPGECDEKPCYTVECIDGECVYTPRDCDDGDPCTIDYCDPVTGECINKPKDCDDGNPCTMDYCDPVTGECVNKPKDCDDDNPCTIDYCDPVTGDCVNKPKDCDDGNPCTIDYCDPVTGDCVNKPKDCD
ncbi:MAG: hypothetical protein KJP00_16735, partial [Bacteroidia bacterium]|nr:hypothetical protein [Bacteroidia bacterium]